MLKGHVFKEQIFGNQIFALFINTFLNGQNGVSNNYKNAMAVTYSGNSITIDSGAVCIQGRFLEEDTSTEIDAGTDNNYCKLVIEIDLDKQNTDEQLVQASYKILKSSSGYPALTQSDIVKNNAGVYQYELARFRTSESGIRDFQDMRTFLDFNSIYQLIKTEYEAVLNELKQELANVEDGSAYVINKLDTYNFSNANLKGSIIKQGRIAVLEFEIISGAGSGANVSLPQNFRALNTDLEETFVTFAGSAVQTVQSHVTLQMSITEIDFTFSTNAAGLRGTMTYITAN